MKKILQAEAYVAATSESVNEIASPVRWQSLTGPYIQFHTAGAIRFKPGDLLKSFSSTEHSLSLKSQVPHSLSHLCLGQPKVIRITRQDQDALLRNFPSTLLFGLCACSPRWQPKWSNRPEYFWRIGWEGLYILKKKNNHFFYISDVLSWDIIELVLL